MKMITILLSFILINVNVFSQLPDGSIAPNWTVTDIEGNSHTLYDYLDQGYSVVLDVSATWCSPCWGFHNAGTLDDIYAEHGPAGNEGVNTNTTDDVMVFFFEGDGTTSLNDLYGPSSNSQGDWVTGVEYPIINSTALNNPYEIGYFPTVYMICPDRIITEVGSNDGSSYYAEPYFYSKISTCPALSTTTNDANILEYDGPNGVYCGADFPSVLTLQNRGTEVLTSLNIFMIVDNDTITTHNWTGSLSMYETEEISLTDMQSLPNGDHSYVLSLSNPNGVQDDDNSNNSVNGTFSTNSTGAEVLLKLRTDGSPDETSWEIIDGTTVVASGGDYDQSNHLYSEYACIDNNKCYTLHVYDSGNNGLSIGTTLLKLNGTTIASFSASEFSGGEIVKEFCIGTTGIENLNIKNIINIFPNPAKDILNIDLSETKSDIKIHNLLGDVVFQGEYNNANVSININSLIDGIYIVSVETSEGLTSKKITIIK